MFEPQEIECPECEGNGWIGKRLPLVGGGIHEVTCEHCNGHGWRPMTEDEANDAAAADAWSDLCESEPPVTMQERHEAAWKLKQELKR